MTHRYLKFDWSRKFDSIVCAHFSAFAVVTNMQGLDYICSPGIRRQTLRSNFKYLSHNSSKHGLQPASYGYKTGIAQISSRRILLSQKEGGGRTWMEGRSRQSEILSPMMMQGEWQVARTTLRILSLSMQGLSIVSIHISPHYCDSRHII